MRKYIKEIKLLLLPTHLFLIKYEFIRNTNCRYRKNFNLMKQRFIHIISTKFIIIKFGSLYSFRNYID